VAGPRIRSRDRPLGLVMSHGRLSGSPAWPNPWILKQFRKQRSAITGLPSTPRRGCPSIIIPLATVLALISGCNSHADRSAQGTGNELPGQQTGQGSPIVPTNDTSFQLMGLSPDYRRVKLQSLLSGQGKQCNYVSVGFLKEAFEGTDIWQVTCPDSGDWLLTIAPDTSVTAEECPSNPQGCR
jgi:hypothetical protein